MQTDRFNWLRNSINTAETVADLFNQGEFERFRDGLTKMALFDAYSRFLELSD